MSSPKQINQGGDGDSSVRDFRTDSKSLANEMEEEKKKKASLYYLHISEGNVI